MMSDSPEADELLMTVRVLGRVEVGDAMEGTDTRGHTNRPLLLLAPGMFTAPLDLLTPPSPLPLKATPLSENMGSDLGRGP